ncbi:MAG: acetate uptake transporter [Candidatus Bathyarchaeia archaeon]
MNEKLANPAPLGLMGFGMTTVLLNLHNAGFLVLDSMILAMGLAYGGFAQIIAGVMEYRKGNTFGTTAFCSYGLFWLSLVTLLIMPNISFLEVQAFSKTSMAAYFFMWGLFTAMMFFGTLKANRALQFVFLSLAALFFLLTARDLTGSTEIGVTAGYEGIVCGLSAVYLAIAEVLNEVHEKTVLPIGPISK